MGPLPPIGAAALPPPIKTKKKVNQGKGTADHLMPWATYLILGRGFVILLEAMSILLFEGCITWFGGPDGGPQSLKWSVFIPLLWIQ